MKTDYKSNFYNDLKKLPQKIQDKIVELTDFVENTDSLNKIQNMKKLEGKRDNIYRIHITYRYIVLIEWLKSSQTVVFLRASSRENAY